MTDQHIPGVLIYSESLLNLQQLDPFTVHVQGDGAAPLLLHIPANGPDRVLIHARSPQQVQERAVPRDPDLGTDHGPGILRETLHGPGGVVMHEVHPDAHREKASRHDGDPDVDRQRALLPITPVFDPWMQVRLFWSDLADLSFSR
jgi:hypothetical protein